MRKSYTATQIIFYQQNILIQNILNNITSAIFLFEDSEIKLSNKQGTLLLEEHNIDQILAQISLKDTTLTHIDLGMRRFAATITQPKIKYYWF